MYRISQMDKLTQETFHKVQSVDVNALRKEPITKIDYIAENIDYSDFFQWYLVPNRPCVFGPHATADWRSVKEWVTEDGRPNMDILAAKFGKYKICVQISLPHW